jgi:hypothetical protein
MANGSYWKSAREWQRMEAPLVEVGFILSDFANEFGLKMTKNYKDWPERSFVWDNNIRRLIQLYLVDEKLLTFNLWLCASQDRGDIRYWKQETPIRGQPIADFKDALAVLLRKGRITLESWSEADLEFATNLRAR